jgi:hypothetical protein
MKFMLNKAKLSFLTIVVFSVFSGCLSIEKHISPNAHGEKAIETHYRSQSVLNLNSDNLKKIQFEGDISVGQTNIKYQRGLANQAQFIAETTNNVFTYVESRTGIDLVANPQVYLLRVQKYPQNLNIHIKMEDPNIFPIPMLVEIDREDPNSIIEDNYYFPYALMHEMAELSLVYPDEKGVVKISHFLILDDYTRWFREGFANYAGYIALDYLHSNPDKNLAHIWDTAGKHETPFSSLSQIGKELFSWKQQSSQKLKGDYYSAALGLFLLMEDKFGKDAVRDIISEFNNYKALNSRDIIKIINTKLKTDIEQVVEDFKFIKIGVYMNQLSPVMALNKGLELEKGFFIEDVEPNSIADKAGIDANDIIIAINDRPITTSLDFDLALFEATKQSTAQVKIWRRDEGYKEIQLTLDKQSEIPYKKTVNKSGEAKNINSLSIVTGFTSVSKKEKAQK